MNKACLLILFALTACGDRGNTGSESGNLSTADSALIRTGPDTGPLTDTDDHNKPSLEGVVLDSPVAPAPGWDSVLENPSGRR